MACEIKEIEYKNYGKCLSISNGVIEAIVTIELGPRVIYFGFLGKENVLYTDLERKYCYTDESISNYYGKNSVCYAYGGHRLWTSPERMPESYYPDNQPVIYAILPESVSFAQQPQKENGLSLTMEIIMAEGANNIMVVHSAQNLTDEPLLEGLSGCTMLRPGGTLIIPQNPAEDNQYLPNRSYALWPYSNITDSRKKKKKKYIVLTQNTSVSQPFRIGTNNYSNWVSYYNQGTVFVKNYVHNRSARYPDFNSSFEAYLNGDMLEIKTLSPLYRLEPKESFRHVENWSLHQTTDSYDFSTDHGVQAMVDSL